MGTIKFLIELFIKITFFASLVILLFTLIRKRRSLKTVIPTILLLIVLISSGIYVYTRIKNSKNIAAKEFLEKIPALDGHDAQEYKLNMLDNLDCEDCKIKLEEDYHYDIIVKEKIVGSGKWELGNDDMFGSYLILENGPEGVVIPPTKRVIDYIDITSE